MRVWENIINKYLREDDKVSEIQTNDSLSLFLKRSGSRIEITDFFPSTEVYKESIPELIGIIGGNPEKFEFLEEGTLRLDNSIARCHIVLPPACLVPLVTIARKTPDFTTLEDLRYSGSMNSTMMNFIKFAVDCNQTLCFSGGTGSGKTTMLEAAARLWDNKLRIGVVEDTPELTLEQPNVFFLKSSVRKPGVKANEIVTLEWCVQQVQRMRSDKIIIGETRGKEFYDFLIAANSGQEGSLTTIHASNPKMCLQKMNSFVSMAISVPQRTVNQTIAATIDFIIQLDRLVDGRYRVTGIEEISSTLSRDDAAVIATQPIFSFNEKEDTWTFSRMSDKKNEIAESYGYNTNSFLKEPSLGGIPQLLSTKRII